MTANQTWRARAPKFGPDDVRLMLAHPTGATNGTRIINLDAEVAQSGANLFRLELTPEQFADLVASRATVVHSTTPIATPLEVTGEADAAHLKAVLTHLLVALDMSAHDGLPLPVDAAVSIARQHGVELETPAPGARDLVWQLRDAVARERAAGDGSYTAQICDLVEQLHGVS